MGSEKQHLNKSPQPAVRKDGVPVNVTPLRDDTLAATQAFVRQKIYEKRSYVKKAFANPYNLSLLAGGLVASVLTFNPLLAVVTVGLEVLWMSNAPGSKKLQEWLWDPQYDAEDQAREDAARAERLKHLEEGDRQRVIDLLARQQEIDSLAAQNPSFTGDLLRTELVKTRKLVDSFLEMALTCSRYERYLDTVDPNALERDKQRWQGKASSERVTEPEREIAKKNYEVIVKRIDKVHEIRDYLGVARAQLDLIENSFQLISDQIVTMQSPAELSGQLDDLLDGVDSIKQTAMDTEKILGVLET